MDVRHWLQDVHQGAAPEIIQAEHAHPIANPTQEAPGRRRYRRRQSSDDSPLKPVTAPFDRAQHKRDVHTASPLPEESISSRSTGSSRCTPSCCPSTSSSKLYKRRPRAKPRKDLYEPCSGVRRKRTKRNSTDAKRNRQKHKNDPKQKSKKQQRKSGRNKSALIGKLASREVGRPRVTLDASKKIGIFNNGRASSPVKRRGLPDLVFSELRFLRKQSNLPQSQSDTNVLIGAKLKRCRKDRAMAQEGEVSEVFAAQLRHHSLDEKAEMLSRGIVRTASSNSMDRFDHSRKQRKHTSLDQGHKASNRRDSISMSSMSRVSPDIRDPRHYQDSYDRSWPIKKPCLAPGTYDQEQGTTKTITQHIHERPAAISPVDDVNRHEAIDLDNSAETQHHTALNALLDACQSVTATSARGRASALVPAKQCHMAKHDMTTQNFDRENKDTTHSRETPPARLSCDQPTSPAMNVNVQLGHDEDRKQTAEAQSVMHDWHMYYTHHPGDVLDCRHDLTDIEHGFVAEGDLQFPMHVLDVTRDTPNFDRDLVRQPGRHCFKQIQDDAYEYQATRARIDEDVHGYYGADNLFCLPAHFGFIPPQEVTRVGGCENDADYRDDLIEQHNHKQQDELKWYGSCQPDDLVRKEGQAPARFWRPNRLY